MIRLFLRFDDFVAAIQFAQRVSHRSTRQFFGHTCSPITLLSWWPASAGKVTVCVFARQRRQQWRRQTGQKNAFFALWFSSDFWSADNCCLISTMCIFGFSSLSISCLLCKSFLYFPATSSFARLVSLLLYS